MILFDLLYNLSALVAISVLSGFIVLRFSPFQWKGKILQGLLFGAAAIIGMHYPFVLTEGIIFDGRSVVISMVTAFFGPVSGSIAALIALLYRYFVVGGSGMLTGSLVIISSFLIGWAFYWYRKHKQLFKFSLGQLYLFGLIVHLVMLLLLFTLPDSHKLAAFQLISFTVVGVFPLVSVLIGKILSDQLLNLQLLSSLKESEEQYRMLVTHQTDLVVKVDAKYKLNYLSPSYCKLFDKTEKELLGSNFMALIHEDDRKLTLEAMKRLKTPPYTTYFEQRLATPKGYRWLAWSGKAVLDKDKQIEAVIGVGRDITERKNAEIERERSEQRYRHLFNASPVGIIFEDVEGLILDVNETFCKVYGYEAGELIGQNISFLVPEQTKHQVTENLKKIITHKVLHSIVPGITKNNEPKVLELLETVITLADGQLGILSIANDITEQEMTKTHLKETRIRNAAIISAIPDMMLSINKKGLIVAVVSNQEGKVTFGSEKVFLNRTVWEVLPKFIGTKVTGYLNQAFDSGELVTFEYVTNTGNQQQCYDIRMIKSSENEVLAIVRDISQRKLQEIELRQQARFIETLLDSVPNPLFYMDNTGIYLGVNKALKQFYGIEAEDIVGKSIFDLSFEEDAENRNASDFAIFEGREGQQVHEREIRLKDGTLKNALITKSPFPDSEGNIGGLIGIIVDITERKHMEEDLRNAKDKAEESDRLKTSFLNNLSHEIRTPMNAIVGFADLLDMGYPPEQQKGFIATINNNADQLLRIIDDVLTIAKFDSEKLSIKLEPFVLNMLFKDLFDTFEPEAKKQQLSLVVETKNLPDDYIFQGDRIKIRQVLAGFISNALKYTTKGEIRFGAEITENNRLCFYTGDTGLGIAASEQEKVFDRFYRTIEAQHLAIRGNGLGLSIAKELVELMDGTIHLKSEAGKGSEFSFVLKPSAKAS